MYRMSSIVSDKLTLTKNIGNILRTFMSRDIAMQFTSVKPMLNKQVLKSTQLYSCIKGKIITKIYKLPTIMDWFALYSMFSETKFFFWLISDAVTKVFSKSAATPLSEEKILKSIRSVLDNAKDWDGQRFVRINKKKLENTTNVSL